MSRHESGEASERVYLLNCRNCGWHDYVDGLMMHADFERECHEHSIRTVLAIGPYCPKGAVTIASVRNPQIRETND